MRKTNLIHFILRSHNVSCSTKALVLKVDSNLFIKWMVYNERRLGAKLLQSEGSVLVDFLNPNREQWFSVSMHICVNELINVLWPFESQH